MKRSAEERVENEACACRGKEKAGRSLTRDHLHLEGVTFAVTNAPLDQEPSRCSWTQMCSHLDGARERRRSLFCPRSCLSLSSPFSFALSLLCSQPPSESTLQQFQPRPRSKQVSHDRFTRIRGKNRNTLFRFRFVPEVAGRIAGELLRFRSSGSSRFPSSSWTFVAFIEVSLRVK